MKYKNFLSYLTIFLISLMGVFASVFVPQKVDTYDELKKVSFGYPFHFIQQDLSAYTPTHLPKYYILGSPREHPFSFFPGYFLLSVGIIFIFLGFTLGVFTRHSFFGFLYRHLVKPLLFLMKPEDAHEHFLKVGKILQKWRLTRRLVRSLFSYQNQKYLSQRIAGLHFPNPVGLSAGFDKEGELCGIMQELGFGFMQVGSITWQAYEGNPKPWLWRLKKSKGIIVNYGLKNQGVEKIVSRLPKAGNKNFPLSVSVAKTNCACNSSDEEAIEDYCNSLRILEREGKGDMYTINISCPNTFGGEPFTSADRLEALLSAIDTLEIQKPVFLKMPIDIDWPQFQSLLDVILQHRVKGVIIGNLKKKREGFLDPKEYEATKMIKGGVSGKATRDTSNEKISKTYQYCGEKLVIIGVGGIFSAEDAYEKIKRGASLVQLITGMIFEGPQLIGAINKGLVRLMKEEGYENIGEVIGQG